MTKDEFRIYFYAEVITLLDKQEIMRERGEHEAVRAYFDGIMAMQRLFNRTVKKLPTFEEGEERMNDRYDEI